MKRSGRFTEMNDSIRMAVRRDCEISRFSVRRTFSDHSDGNGRPVLDFSPATNGEVNVFECWSSLSQ